MESNPLTIIKLLLPRTPLILKTAIFNTLSISKSSKKQDLNTELFVTILRSIISIKMPMGKMQSLSLRDPGVKGRMWISKVTIPSPNENLPQLLSKAIENLGDGTESYKIPEIAEITGEWTGHKSGEYSHGSDIDQYQGLMTEVTSSMTVLYFHGGGYFLMDPASHRTITSHIAKLTKSRCFSVRYRLAPQNPFPTQLLDALISYLYLLSPPKGSFHDPIPAKNIIFSGDSAGGNLSLTLILLLLTFRKIGITSIKFQGKDVPIELPAGCAVQSPWCDISLSLPSVKKNAHFDYLNPNDDYIPDSIWPTSPPRAEIYCEATNLTHPLVSPVVAKPELWKGAPPIFISLGNEILEDEICVMARNIHNAGVNIQAIGYEGMPHCFSMLFPKSVAGKDCFSRLANFIVDNNRSDTVLWLKAFSKMEFQENEWESITSLTNERVLELIKEKKVKGKEKEVAMLKIKSHL